jgi:maltooligosyltrehalose synthase
MLLTLPGIPVLYYGDELGMAGANDPDSRRPLPEILGSALPEVQAELLRQTGRIGRLRACLPALRRGQRQPLTSDRDSSVALHLPPPQENPAEQSVTNQDPVIVVLLRASSDRQLTVTGLPAGLYRDVLSGATLSVPVAPEQARARINLLAKAESAAIYVPANSQCWPGVNSAD